MDTMVHRISTTSARDLLKAKIASEPVLRCLKPTITRAENVARIWKDESGLFVSPEYLLQVWTELDGRDKLS